MSSSKLDCITQLTRVGGPIHKQKFLTKAQLNKRFKELDNLFENDKAFKANRVTALQHAIDLRIAYYHTYATMGEVDDDAEVYKDQLLLTVKEALATNKKRGIETVVESEYDALSVSKTASSEEIEQGYIRFLEAFKSKLDKFSGLENLSLDDLDEIEKAYYRINEAYNILSNPELKLNIDTKNNLNFEPNQSSLYQKGMIAQIVYIPVGYYENDLPPKGLVIHNSRRDKILMIQTGELGFGKFRKSDGSLTYTDSDALEEYKVVVTYNDPQLKMAKKKRIQETAPERWNEVADGEVFTIYGNINRRLLLKSDVDVNYIKYVADVFLSNINLEAAEQYNGGYIGEVGVNSQNGEYQVFYQQDLLCLACEFEKVKRDMGKVKAPTKVALDGYTPKRKSIGESSEDLII